MNFFAVIKYLLTISAIAFLFFSWKISVGLFLAASIVHVIPYGPDRLLSVITGYLVIGGIISIFFDWKVGICLIVAGLITAKFRVWGNIKNREYYRENNRETNTDDEDY